MLNRRQISLVHVAKAKLGMSDDDYRALLARAAGVDSAAALDPRGFNVVMYEFERLGFQSSSTQRNLGRRPGMASPQQVAKIRDLWAAFTAGEGNDASLGKWLERRGWASSIRFLDRDAAHKAIGGLTKMVQKKARAA